MSPDGTPLSVKRPEASTADDTPVPVMLTVRPAFVASVLNECAVTGVATVPAIVAPEPEELPGKEGADGDDADVVPPPAHAAARAASEAITVRVNTRLRVVMRVSKRKANATRRAAISRRILTRAAATNSAVTDLVV